jgi:TolA-binding protein
MHRGQQNRSNQLENQINDLEKQISLLRQTHQEKKQTNQDNNNATHFNNVTSSKNGERPRYRGGNTNNENNIETSEILDYISTAMATLSAFEKRLTTHVSTVPTHSGL